MIIPERLGWIDPDLSEIRMSGVDQPVRLAWRQYRGDDENCGSSALNKVVTDTCEFRRRGCLTPVPWQAADRDRNARDATWYSGTDQHQVRGWVVNVDVHEVLNDCQGEVFGGVSQTDTGTRPASTEAVSTFSAERLPGIGSPKDSEDLGQLTPPYAIRPSTFSTARAPGSVSSASSGARPLKARFGLFNHRLAFWSSPI